MLEEFTMDNKVYSILITRFFILYQLGITFVVVFPNIEKFVFTNISMYALPFAILSVLIQLIFIKHDPPKNLIS